MSRRILNSMPMNFEALYRDGLHYDLQTAKFVDDIPFYQRISENCSGPALELGCGTGRITIPIAEKGVPITGLDIARGMLDRARKKAADKGVDIEWFKADCRDFHLNQKFSLIIFPFNSLLHFHDRESLEACFDRVKEHLAPGGRFVFDVFNPDFEILTRDPSERYPHIEYVDPEGRGTVTVTMSNTHDKARQINNIKYFYNVGGDEWIVEGRVRIIYPQELDALLYYKGFKVEVKYGDFDESPFTSESPKQIVICSPV